MPANGGAKFLATLRSAMQNVFVAGNDTLQDSLDMYFVIHYDLCRYDSLVSLYLSRNNEIRFWLFTTIPRFAFFFSKRKNRLTIPENVMRACQATFCGELSKHLPRIVWIQVYPVRVANRCKCLLAGRLRFQTKRVLREIWSLQHKLNLVVCPYSTSLTFTFEQQTCGRISIY